jgi:hypothetical protein
VLFTILHRRDAEGIKFAVVFPRNTTVRWKRGERIGAMPCIWRRGIPDAESEAGNAAASGASGLHALTELPTRHGQLMRSACQAALDPEGGAADELRAVQ